MVDIITLFSDREIDRQIGSFRCGLASGKGAFWGSGSAASRFAALSEAKTPRYGAILATQNADPEQAEVSDIGREPAAWGRLFRGQNTID